MFNHEPCTMDLSPSHLALTKPMWTSTSRRFKSPPITRLLPVTLQSSPSGSPLNRMGRTLAQIFPIRGQTAPTISPPLSPTPGNSRLRQTPRWGHSLILSQPRWFQQAGLQWVKMEKNGVLKISHCSKLGPARGMGIIHWHIGRWLRTHRVALFHPITKLQNSLATCRCHSITGVQWPLMMQHGLSIRSTINHLGNNLLQLEVTPIPFLLITMAWSNRFPLSGQTMLKHGRTPGSNWTN